MRPCSASEAGRGMKAKSITSFDNAFVVNILLLPYTTLSSKNIYCCRYAFAQKTFAALTPLGDLSKQNRSLSKLFELLSKQNRSLSKLFELLSKNKLFLSNYLIYVIILKI